MATRTICFPISGYPYCKEQPVTFTWINGSKRQNIRAVHDAVHTTDPDVSILEVSSASVQPEGEAVSSLRLLLRLDSVAQDVPICTVFEAAMVFEHGGPFADLLTCAPSKVHKDTRLRTNGKLLRYSLEGSEYPIEPHPDSFFEWLYCRALKQFPEKAAQLSRYNAFSDIAAAAYATFSPSRNNCFRSRSMTAKRHCRHGSGWKVLPLWQRSPLHSLSAGGSCCTGVQTGGERWCCWRWCAGQASLRYCSSCCLPYFRFWYCFCVERGLISLLPLFSVIAFLYGFFRCICYIFSSSFNCKPQVLQKYFRNPVNFTQMAFHNTSDDLP